MTTVRLFRLNNDIIGVEAVGHADYAKRGQDIVCAAVSSLVQGALVGIVKVLNAPTEVKQSDGYLRFFIKDQSNIKLNHEVTIILETMHCAITEIAQDYPSHVKLENKYDYQSSNRGIR
jgi:hypothetical protein